MIDVMPEVYSVAELNNYIKTLFDNDFSLSAVAVEGEVSNFRKHTSGHWYLTLKDEKSSISAAMFRNANARVRFDLKDGMKVLAVGRVSVYEKTGTYSLYINDIMPVGAGDLAVAFEQLRAKLEAEGLFSESHKKPLPRYPKTVGVVTAETGAALLDICKVLKRRWPLADILLSPSLVQGTEAPASIVRAIEKLDASGLCDVMIVGRGGGSIEDLWCFNDERVARAVFACRTPVISGVGHEPDTTIIDYVADRRAPTPSAAAELAVPDRAEESARVEALYDAASRRVRNKLEMSKLTFRMLDEKIHKSDTLFADRSLYLDELTDRMTRAVADKFKDRKYTLTVLAGKLDALSPLKVLSRGYSIAEGKNGVIKSTADVSAGDKVEIRVNDGTFCAEVL